MLTILLALATYHQQVNPVKPFNPWGPKIRFTMEGGKSFVLTTDPGHSPRTVRHIVDLVKSGFYDRQRIHRVENWVTQWGAPASKTEPLDIKGKDGKMELNEKVGDGGSGHDLPFEGNTEVDYVRGVAGIASEGLQMGGDSQIFILKKDATRLWNSYAVVGKVTEGMDVVDGIKRGDRIIKAVVLGDKVPAKHVKRHK